VKIFRLLLVPAILHLVVMARSASAEWYEITVEHGLTTETFVGFTGMSTDAMALALSGSKPIVLENLRVYQARVGTAGMQWWPDREGQKLFLRPERIVYFYRLPEDPAAK
jgi:tellurite resistance protein TehA-like permease